jgi:mannose-6-phosphate isomerase-like protein (cupin superfamily)
MLTNHLLETRPWGKFEQFTQNEVSTVKIITVEPGQRLSLQQHALRSEYWYILQGTGLIHLSGTEREVFGGDEVSIPVNAVHRITAVQGSSLKFLEIGFGTFDEGDITRLEDDYARA